MRYLDVKITMIVQLTVQKRMIRFSGSNRKYGIYTITRRIDICRSF